MASYESSYLEQERRAQRVKNLFESLQDDIEHVDFSSKELYFLPGDSLLRLSNLKRLDLSFDFLKVS